MKLKEIENKLRKNRETYRELIRLKVEASSELSGVPFFLHKIILERTGEDLPQNCATRKFFIELDQIPIDECKQQARDIAYRIHTYGKQRRWIDKIAPPETIVETLDQIVNEAIRQAELSEADLAHDRQSQDNLSPQKAV
jgi:ribosome-binding protein aMBF1 (putative translation factor)